MPASLQSPPGDDSALSITVLGASAVRPNPGGACSGYLVSSNGQRYLVDCGTGVASRLQQVMEPADLTGILISHAHPDHILDLVALRYGFLYGPSRRPAAPIPLWVGPGVDAVLAGIAESLGQQGDFWETFVRQTYQPHASLLVEGLQIDYAP